MDKGEDLSRGRGVWIVGEVLGLGRGVWCLVGMKGRWEVVVELGGLLSSRLEGVVRGLKGTLFGGLRGGRCILVLGVG